MTSKTQTFQSARHVNALYCGRSENLALVERAFGVTVISREDWIRVEGEEEAVRRADSFFSFLDEGRKQGLAIKNADFAHMLEGFERGDDERMRSLLAQPLVLSTNRRSIIPNTLGQKAYLQAILSSPVVFGIGPAGTGKTYLAVAAAVSALLKNQVQKVIRARPAVEAGEALGFLPGDLREKILPYLRPLYDAMHDMLDREDVGKLMERGAIEIAPLAYMRGRTLSNAFVILDEAQNTTVPQMLMFLTRLGEGSRMVVTGDPSQVDLPGNVTSGLADALRRLDGIDSIGVTRLGAGDVVRHPIVSRIVTAYEAPGTATRGPRQPAP
jgi:phosphate starvation-inducible PhoH-like protein